MSPQDSAAAGDPGDPGDPAGTGLAQDPASRFADCSYLTYLVPAATGLELETAFCNAEAGKPMLEAIRTRDALFFGESPPPPPPPPPGSQAQRSARVPDRGAPR